MAGAHAAGDVVGTEQRVEEKPVFLQRATYSRDATAQGAGRVAASKKRMLTYADVC
jgi:hypothetical protein